MSRLPRPVRRLLAALLSVVLLGAAFLTVLSLRTGQVRPVTPAPGTVRVITYNVQAALGGVGRVAEDLRPLNADVIALQEVERNVARSLRADQPAELAAALGMEYVFVPAITSAVNGDHGLAVLSRFPLDDVVVTELPQGGGKWPRVALGVRVRSPEGDFRVVTVHLARPWGWPLHNTRTRLRQLQTVTEAYRDEPLPLLLCGDFNAFPWSLEALRLQPRFRNAWRPWRDGPSPSWQIATVGWPGAGALKIDHVFHDEAWESRGNWSAPPGASDHRPVIADLALTRPSAPGDAGTPRPSR
ncbi:MAG: hypothetical protein HKN12_08030 [Gemmatimonadetes bacterium]|nr:hypothetical protein [Gemmatimonadota bacterium]